MAIESIDRDTITYSVAINACGKGGAWGVVLALLGRMARDLRSHLSSSACALVSLLRRTNQVCAPAETVRTRASLRHKQWPAPHELVSVAMQEKVL